MKRAEICIATASGAVLDYLVERAVAGHEYSEEETLQAARAGVLRYSTDWGRGGPLIEKYIGLMMVAEKDAEPRYSECADSNPCSYANGPTYLVSAMRAIVISLLGGAARVPIELLEVEQ